LLPAADGPEEQTDGRSQQQKAQAVVKSRMPKAEIFGKDREQQSGRETKTAKPVDAAGWGIGLTDIAAAHTITSLSF
jgi:hypothetical protein